MIEIAEALRSRLEASAGAIRSLTATVDDLEARWNPDPARWSILEVVNHLADEEVEDFRTRLDILLHRPDEPFPSIDPQGWVKIRRYADRDLRESLDRFLAERERSLAWLATIPGGDPDRVRLSPSGRPFTPRQMAASWAAHDLLHVRQITRLRYDFLAHETRPGTLEYAGTW